MISSNNAKKDILPIFYLITPDFDGHHDAYFKQLELSLINGIKLVQLRSKNLSINDYIKLAEDVLSLAHAYQAKLLLNGPVDLLSTLAADGIHLPSEQYSGFNNRPISHDYLLSLACHNKEQLKLAENIDADFAVLSPIFATPSSPKGVPLGWSEFSKLANSTKLPIYALGGLDAKDYQVAKDHGAHGIAAKRAFNLNFRS